MKKLTHSEYLQLQGLFHIGRDASVKWQEYEKAIDKLAGLSDEGGSLFGDALITGERTVDEVLEVLEIEYETENNTTK